MAAIGTRGSTIRLISGLYLDLADPRPEHFTFADIAGGLSKICRFGGQIDSFYSVAQHSVLCSYVAEHQCRAREVQAACLLHDAAEAFVGDMVRPLKELVPGFKAIEDRIFEVIWAKYMRPFSWNRLAGEVKEIDNSMLFAERDCLFRKKDDEIWYGENEVEKINLKAIVSLSPGDAMKAFFDRAEELEIVSAN